METAILWHTGPLIDDDEVAQVHALAADAERVDGAAPLSEQPLLNLRAHSDDVVHLLTWRSGELAGYAQVDRRGAVPTAELVVRPAHRRHGLGFHLLASAGDRAAATAADETRGSDRPAGDDATGGGDDTDGSGAVVAAGRPPLRVWAHGDLPAARALAARSGYVPVRELRVLERPLGGAARHPAPAVPEGLRLRAFVPGQDDDAWVRANALAFAEHPEQGRLTVADLHDRVREDWFDPAGLQLLEHAGSGDLVGFVWTKIPVGQPDTGAREGEIYVVGVVPDAQGEGLGGLLTGVGLAHLAGAGVTTAVLYVDGDNTPALRTYERAGFAPREVHVQYAPG